MRGISYANLITRTHAELDASWLHGLRSLKSALPTREQTNDET